MSATPSSPVSLAGTDADLPPSTAVSSPPATDAAVCIHLSCVARGELIAAIGLGGIVGRWSGSRGEGVLPSFLSPFPGL